LAILCYFLLCDTFVGYFLLLKVISPDAIIVYSKLYYHRLFVAILLVVIVGYFIHGYWCLFYCCLYILLLAIGGYLKLNYHMLLIAIGGTILLMAISGYFINGYWWLNDHNLLVSILL